MGGDAKRGGENRFSRDGDHRKYFQKCAKRRLEKLRGVMLRKERGICKGLPTGKRARHELNSQIENFRRPLGPSQTSVRTIGETGLVG